VEKRPKPDYYLPLAMEYSWQQPSEIRRNFQTFGADGLLDDRPEAKGPHLNRVDEAVGAGDHGGSRRSAGGQ
jgi:hypothetical protein